VSLEPCSICLEPLARDVVRPLVCQHQFHKACVVPWLKRQPRCPMCRTFVKVSLPFVCVMRLPALHWSGPLAWLAAAAGQVKVRPDALELSGLCGETHLLPLTRISEIRLIPRLGCTPSQLLIIMPGRARDPRQVYSVTFKGSSDAQTAFDMLNERMHYGSRQRT